MRAKRPADVPVSLAWLFEQCSPEPNSGCWLWMRGADRHGYGRVSKNGRPAFAHRVAYALACGPILPGLELDHLCRVPACINPAHLEAVTHLENVRRGLSRLNGPTLAAGRTHCINGHTYTPENTYRGHQSRRRCKECNRQRLRADRAARQEIRA